MIGPLIADKWKLLHFGYKNMSNNYFREWSN